MPLLTEFEVESINNLTKSDAQNIKLGDKINTLWENYTALLTKLDEDTGVTDTDYNTLAP